MTDTVSAGEANRTFSSLLRRVREGRSVLVTSHGKPIAKIVPVGQQDDETARGAPRALLARRSVRLARSLRSLASSFVR